MLPVAILAGGLVTRLRPLTETIPKSLVEIDGEPFLWHQLRLLRGNGIGAASRLPYDAGGGQAKAIRLAAPLGRRPTSAWPARFTPQ